MEEIAMPGVRWYYIFILVVPSIPLRVQSQVIWPTWDDFRLSEAEKRHFETVQTHVLHLDFPQALDLAAKF